MRKILSAFLVLALCACAGTKPYRVSKDGYANVCEYRATGDCPAAALIRAAAPAPYELAFVEIDEQGYFADRAQAEAAVALASAKPARGRAYVVVFVHGWFHNASVDDKNVDKFHGALNLVSSWRPNDTVRGVYVGWRGDSVTVWGLDYSTFWDRKNTSEEVGRGSLYEFLLRLEREVKRQAGADSRLVLIGHSFGASVAFNALAQLYMQRFIEGLYSTAAGPRFRGYGDLVMLINPAIEGMRYMPFHSALHYYYGKGAGGVRADFSRENRPALVILSSEGDWATRKTFQVARFFTTLSETHPGAGIRGSGPGLDEGYSEWVMDFKTLGNYERFHTHASLAVAPQLDKAQTSCPPLAYGQLRRILAGSRSEQSFPGSGIVLKHTGDLPPTMPYWSASMSADIVSGHSDIGTRSLVCWTMQLLDSD